MAVCQYIYVFDIFVTCLKRGYFIFNPGFLFARKISVGGVSIRKARPHFLTTGAFE